MRNAGTGGQMVTPPDETTADPYAVIAALRQQLAQSSAERDAAVAREAKRDSDYAERAAHQGATVEVLQAMAVSPGDPKPVFEVIVRRACDLCDAYGATLAQVVDSSIVLRAYVIADEAEAKRHEANFPRPVAADTMFGRAILAREPVQLPDVAADQTYELREGTLRGAVRAQAAVPLMRDGEAIGAINITRRQTGEFSQAQIELLQVFANQAVIAISSAETYRALQTRTTELQESLEYQTATSEVLKVISGSDFELEPVFQAVVETATRMCRADQAVIYRYHDGVYRWAAGTSLLPDYQRIERSVSIAPGTGTLVGRVALERRPIEIIDALADPLYEVKDDARVGGIRTLLGVPLMRDGTPIGVIGLARQRVEPFTGRQIELVSTFADQAVIAVENARLLTEQREALEQQTATAEVLQVINTNPFNLTPVFDAILELAIRVCDSAFGTLRVYVTDSFRTVAMRNIPPEFEVLLRAPGPAPPGSVPYRIAQGEALVHIADITDDDRYRSGYAGRRALADAGGARTAVWVALRKDDTVLGLITIYRQEVRPFSDKQIDLLKNFAAQAVIAMENARLINETREALEQQTATAEVLQVINTSPGDLAPVFQTLLQKAHTLCEASFGALMTYDGERFHAVAHQRTPAPFREFLGSGILPGRGDPFRLIVEGAAFSHTHDMLEVVARYPSEPSPRAAADLGGIRTLLVVPLRKDGELLGVITAYRQEMRPFSDKQIALLQNFAAQAVIAMENARLLNEVRQRQEELRITFENMGDGVAMFDETQRLVAWNGKFQEILDLPDTLPEQDRTYEEFLRFLASRGDFGAGVDTAEQVHELVASTGQPYGYERTRPDGRVIEIRRNPVPDGGFVLMYSDITERKRSETEIRDARDAAEAALRELKAAQANLIQAEKMASLGQLTAGIAHEIKNPLNFVNNFAELSGDLLDELHDAVAGNLQAEIDELTATLKGNLAKIAEHGKRADGIVKAMLEHSRGSSGERRMVDLNMLVDEALNLAYHGVRAQDQSFSITLERDFGTTIAPIELTPQDMTRVLLNLFSNGFYATGKRQNGTAEAGFEPTLKVTTRDLGDAVEIRVRDNGTGVPADIKDKLFQPFFTTKPTGEGTGLGLSISYDIVTKQHGGSITVDSEVGEYSEFTIRLPRNS
jgi:GAF domain-containing protein/nitrogen-specific signal transduction histidine kinase